ncbi:MAG: cytochrome P450 [Actinomycetota bacterium]
MSRPPRPLAPVDLADPRVFTQGIPHTAFETIRSEPGLVWNAIDGDRDDGYWVVTRHADVVTVSRDPETFSCAVGHIQIYDIDEDALDARASMIDMDPPVHTRLRRLASKAFTPRHVQSYTSAIRSRVRAALDDLVAAGGGDWVETIAKPIPIGVICDILGVPDTDHALMVELSDHLVAGTSTSPLPADAYGNTTPLRLLPFNSPAAHALNEYALDLGRRRRNDPHDDLVTKLIEAEIDGERLTDDEFANFFRLMIFAGNETTRSSMSHLALHLVDHPDAFSAVAADRSLLAGAAEEVVRYSSPILYFRRTATRDCALSGTAIEAGEKVVMYYAAADFDPAVFPDPLRFDVTRPNVPANVAFGGGGAHFCLGASLARLELVELIDEILDRDLTLEIGGEPVFVDSNFVNGIEMLDVSVT